MTKTTKQWLFLGAIAAAGLWWWRRSPARNAATGTAVTTQPVAAGEQRLAVGEPMATVSPAPWT